jgi:hypothetical protein
MGSKELQALIEVLQDQLARGLEGNVLGAWNIHFDKARQAFQFDKCENDGYCEERPSVIALDRTVLDTGGPLFG